MKRYASVSDMGIDSSLALLQEGHDHFNLKVIIEFTDKLPSPVNYSININMCS